MVERTPGAPRLSLPGRQHLLLTGPLHTALDVGEQVTTDWLDPQSPNLLWLADRAWCPATEVDLDSALVGGPVDADDDLSSVGDHVDAPAPG